MHLLIYLTYFIWCCVLDVYKAERAEKAAAEAKKQADADAKAAKEAEKAARIVSWHADVVFFSRLCFVLLRILHQHLLIR